jgi:hypothetical protein
LATTIEITPATGGTGRPVTHPVQRSSKAAAQRLGAATLRPPDDSRPNDTIRDAQRGGAGRGGAAQHVAGDGADARDRGEHRVRLVVDGFFVEVDDAAGIRQIVWHEHDAAYRQRGVLPRLRKLVVGTAADDAAAQAGDGHVIQHRAERRRGEHVNVLGVDFLGRRQGGAVGGGGLRAAVPIKVTDHQSRPAADK